MFSILHKNDMLIRSTKATFVSDWLEYTQVHRGALLFIRQNMKYLHKTDFAKLTFT